MYFFNLKSLTKELKEQNMSEKDKFLYLICNIFVYFTISFSSFWIDYKSTTLVVIISTFPLLYLPYVFNGGGRGSYFLEKYLSLSWVAFFRVVIPFVLWFFLLCLIIGVWLGTYAVIAWENIDNVIKNISPVSNNLVFTILFQLTYIVFVLWRMSIYFKKTL